MVRPCSRFYVELVSSSLQLAVQTAFAAHQFFEFGAKIEEESAFIGCVVLREYAGYTGGSWFNPRAVGDEEIRPAECAVRIRIAKHRADPGPRLAMCVN